MKMLEIKFHGRGGQGVVIASQMLGMAFFRKDMYPQCYSLFGVSAGALQWLVSYV